MSTDASRIDASMIACSSASPLGWAVVGGEVVGGNVVVGGVVVVGGAVVVVVVVVVDGLVEVVDDSAVVEVRLAVVGAGSPPPLLQLETPSTAATAIAVAIRRISTPASEPALRLGAYSSVRAGPFVAEVGGAW